MIHIQPSKEMENSVMKHIVAVNASPRTGWNTEILIQKGTGKHMRYSQNDPIKQRAGFVASQTSERKYRRN